MVSGPNEIPEIKAVVQKTPAQLVRRVPAEAAKPAPEPERKLVQAPDTVQLSPRAQEASRVSASAERAPEVRPERVEQASAQVRSQSNNSASTNAKLAEKLLTES